MPCPNVNSLWQIIARSLIWVSNFNFIIHHHSFFLLINMWWCREVDRADQPLILVISALANVLATLVHELNIDRRINSPVKVDYMGVRMVASCKYLSRIRWNLQIEFIEYSFTLVHLTQFIIKVFCHIQCLHWLLVVSNVPNLDWQIVAREDIVIWRRREFRLRHWINYIREEVLARRIFLKLESSGRVFKLRTHS